MLNIVEVSVLNRLLLSCLFVGTKSSKLFCIC